MLFDVLKFHLHSEQKFRLFTKEIKNDNFSTFSTLRKRHMIKLQGNMITH